MYIKYNHIRLQVLAEGTGNLGSLYFPKSLQAMLYFLNANQRKLDTIGAETSWVWSRWFFSQFEGASKKQYNVRLHAGVVACHAVNHESSQERPSQWIPKLEIRIKGANSFQTARKFKPNKDKNRGTHNKQRNVGNGARSSRIQELIRYVLMRLALIVEATARLRAHPWIFARSSHARHRMSPGYYPSFRSISCSAMSTTTIANSDVDHLTYRNAGVYARLPHL
jgi:hypothetical protein